MARAALLVGLLSVPLGYVATNYGPGFTRGLTVFGIGRTPVAGVYESVVTLEETGICEDLAYHAETGLIFTLCEQSLESRLSWFPPLARFDTDGLEKSEAGLFVIDPKVLESRLLPPASDHADTIEPQAHIIPYTTTDPKN